MVLALVLSDLRLKQLRSQDVGDSVVEYLDNFFSQIIKLFSFFFFEY